MTKRTVILHYHLFKNAGTSLDRILRQNFPDRWLEKEFPPDIQGNGGAVAQWIQENPHIIAFSSHTVTGSLPEIPNTDVITVLFLRDPIDRIVSVYGFERDQVSDTFGAKLAKKTTFSEYVNTRLSTRGDRQCRDFQTHRLSRLSAEKNEELPRALSALANITVVGVVERFSPSIEALARAVTSKGLPFTPFEAHSNRSRIRGDIDANTIRTLESSNELDKVLHNLALRFYDFLSPTGVSTC